MFMLLSAVANCPYMFTNHYTCSVLSYYEKSTSKNSHAMHMDHLAENVHIILLVSTQLSFSGPIKEYKQQCVTNILAYKVTNY